MNEQVIITIITAIITSGVFSTMIAGLFSLFLGESQYKYEY